MNFLKEINGFLKKIKEFLKETNGNLKEINEAGRIRAPSVPYTYRKERRRDPTECYRSP